mgnify:FL=1|tara:strand:+ start:62 stop:607 length:546 start_codon:yes stop_codon:yes gene_type:complete
MSKTLKIKEWDINLLIGAEYNPRKLNENQKQKLKDSINRFGLVDPVLVNVNEDRKGIIIGGHQRTTVARELGFLKMPCIELNLTLNEEKELNVRLNKNTGEFDYELLEEHFDESKLINWGFENEDLEFFDIIDEEEKEELDLSDDIQMEYKLEIDCVSEREQEKLFNKLNKDGFQCRILTL